MKENLYVVVKGNVPQEKVRAIVAEISECYEKLGVEPEFCEVLIFRSRYDVDRFIEEENELVYSRLGVRISGIAPDSSVTHCQKKLYWYHLRVKPEEKRVWEKAVNEINVLALLLMDVFKVLSGVTPLIEATKDAVLTALYEENLNLIPEHVKKHFQRMLNKLRELGEDTLENIFNMADELYELLIYLLP
ncbi:MAG: hypothetical protein B6U95_07765 [Thermofilum sp. ex4484_82]|nr:MAG: hypothetical protein B6U95_07765 [Thermofilum sp. ex4484_82]OYT36912.1 MAG: hypothetical protein B6U96_07765 [Archaeoglobales archaeon ex4484_92]